uniref:HECT domain-containing protein n=1 Tax=Poecilia formosa TaxID=48698 RepID=A0A087X6G5_POEFO
IIPTSSEEIAHLQAGLGKRTLSIQSDLTHRELSSLFNTTYPKMQDLQDRWLLYKASVLKGGNGRRKLFPVLLEAEGYTGSLIKRASIGGKHMLYIMPLQDELDLTPLPADSPEFALMPKAACKKCNASMPLQMLTLHIEQCSELSSSDSEIFSLCKPATHYNTDEIKCPLCNKLFPLLDIEVHASCCGERFLCNCFHVLLRKKIYLYSEDDVVKWAATQVDPSKTFDICVSKDSVVERGLILWQRQKNGGPVNPLKVSFLGEIGVDTGALRKEFLTIMVAGIERRLFEGDSDRGKIPKYSFNDLDKQLFKVAGEIFAVSLAQGGPAPCFLQEWCYHYLVTGEIETQGMYDAELSTLITKIKDASDLSVYSEDILECGYTGPIDTEHMNSILRAVSLHATTKRTPMLKQLREGLGVYNLINLMEKKPDECRRLFVFGHNEKVDSNYIMSHIDPQLSPQGSRKQAQETKILEYLQDFLYELEDAEQADNEEVLTLTVPMVMQWMTGQAHKHLLVSERNTFKVTVIFDHHCLEHTPGHTVCYPVVSACTSTVTFPMAHLSDYESFKSNFSTAVTYGFSFERL